VIYHGYIYSFKRKKRRVRKKEKAYKLTSVLPENFININNIIILSRVLLPTKVLKPPRSMAIVIKILREEDAINSPD